MHSVLSALRALDWLLLIVNHFRLREVQVVIGMLGAPRGVEATVLGRWQVAAPQQANMSTMPSAGLDMVALV